MRKTIMLINIVAITILLFSITVSAKTLILEGDLNGTVAMQQAMEFSVNRGSVDTFSFKFALPANFNSRTVSQRVSGQDLQFNPKPSSSVMETDRFGNRFQRVSWDNINQNIRISLKYDATIQTKVSALESKTPFPLGSVSPSEAVYLQFTNMVQNDPNIKSMAHQLTGNAKSEYEAVSAIINWVTDNIKYSFNPPKYDASYTLSTRSGNCQNFAHLSIAMLRSVGIPARIVGGITLKQGWKVPIDAKNSIVQSIGQGGHAWLEVYFPDLGWLPYDPQQSRQFTSSRHIKQTHGLDSQDINDTWRGGPYLPAYSELIDGRYIVDEVSLKMKTSVAAPRPYILSNTILAAVSGTTPVTAPVLQSPTIAAAPSEPAQGTGAGPAETRIVTEETEQPQVKPTRPVITKPQPAIKPVIPPKPVVVAKPAPSPVEPAPKPTVVAPPVPKVEPVTKPVVIARPAPLPAEPAPKPTVVAPPVLKVEPVTKPVVIARSEPEITAPPVPAKPHPGTMLVFGNMDFPNTLNLYNVSGDTGTRVFERETSEYVTSGHIYAQAVQVKDAMNLDRISLAMRKFGGDGSIYIDLVKDKNGSPDIMQGIRSNLLDLERVPRKAGYYWVDFTFPPSEGFKPHQLEPGKYWIVFRASGEAIMNWFFIPGKPYGEGDDTRSTAKGFKWEDILNYDFVFKVTGKAI